MKRVSKLVRATLIAGGAVGLVVSSTVAANAGISPACGNAPFNNPSSMFLPFPGATTSSTIAVSGLSGGVIDVDASICEFTPSRPPDDFDILLVAPSGESVVLMADVGGTAFPVTPSPDYTFDDSASGFLDDDGPMSPTDSYQPTQGTPCPCGYNGGAPAPTGSHGSTMSSLNGIDPNGTWNLYLFNDAPPPSPIDLVPAGAGVMRGWGLRISTGSPNPNPTNPTLTVARAGTGSGVVDSTVVIESSAGEPVRRAAQIHCPPACSEQVERGTFVRLHATPADGSTFEGWAGPCTGTGECDVTVNEDTLVVARFELSDQPPPSSTSDLSLSAMTSGEARVGTSATFSFTASNAGPGDELGATVSGAISGEFSLAGARPSAPAGDCEVAGGAFTCELGEIASGESSSADLVLIPTRGGSLSVQAVVSGSGSDTNTDNDSASSEVSVNDDCTITGTPGPDVLSGTPGTDVICGGAGRDVISGWDGDDIVRGGPGADVLRGGTGDDLVLGMGGPDRLLGGGGTDECDATESDRPIGCEELAA